MGDIKLRGYRAVVPNLVFVKGPERRYIPLFKEKSNIRDTLIIHRTRIPTDEEVLEYFIEGATKSRSSKSGSSDKDENFNILLRRFPDFFVNDLVNGHEEAQRYFMQALAGHDFREIR